MAKRTTQNGLANYSITDLQKVLEEKEAAVADLEAAREEILAELAEVDANLAELTGSKSGKQGRRPRKASTKKKRTTKKKSGGRGGSSKLTLGEAMHKALKGKSMSVADTEKAIKKVGYKSSSPNMRNMIGQQFAKDKKRFKRVDRGVYTAK